MVPRFKANAEYPAALIFPQASSSSDHVVGIFSTPDFSKISIFTYIGYAKFNIGTTYSVLFTFHTSLARSIFTSTVERSVKIPISTNSDNHAPSMLSTSAIVPFVAPAVIAVLVSAQGAVKSSTLLPVAAS